MTRNEAEERARSIWGSEVVKVSPAVGHQSGQRMTQWWVDTRCRSHGLDENGHVTCGNQLRFGHEECDRLEQQSRTEVVH